MEQLTERLFAIEKSVRGWPPGVRMSFRSYAVLLTDKRIVAIDRGTSAVITQMFGSAFSGAGSVLGASLSSIVKDILSRGGTTPKEGTEIQSSEIDKLIEANNKNFSVLYSNVREGNLKKGGLLWESSLVLQTLQGKMMIQGLDSKSLAPSLSILMQGKLKVKV